MTSMTRTTVGVTGGVDTHGQSHHAAVIDHLGRHLGDRHFPASPAGYGALAEWLQGHGELDRVGVEGTGTYGAALARHLREAGILLVEVDRPDRRARRAHGKSRSEEHTSELQSLTNLVCRLLLEKKKKKKITHTNLILNIKQTKK